MGLEDELVNNPRTIVEAYNSFELAEEQSDDDAMSIIQMDDKENFATQAGENLQLEEKEERDDTVEDILPLNSTVGGTTKSEKTIPMWVQQNIIELSKEFGVHFQGCEEAALKLFMNIDGKRQVIDEISGAIVPMTPKEEVSKELKNLEPTSNFISFGTRSRGGGKTQNFSWHLSGVYAPNNREEREEVWGELGAVKSLFNGPWVIAGDFNVVRFPSEKKNCNRITKAMEDFSDFIEDMELVDPPLIGGSFTWRKGDRHVTATRLDRFLFSEEWEISFKKIKQALMPRVTLDHNPLLLECGNWERSQSYFKFKNWWLQTENFKERVKGWWDSEIFVGRPDDILACKMKALKVKLKEWSKTVQGNLGLQKQNILNQLYELDMIQEQRCLSEDESYLRAVLSVEFEEVAKREEVAYSTTIREEITGFYQNLYRENEHWRPQFSPREQVVLNEEDNLFLQSQFGEQEIKECVCDYAGEKAPGPDSFTMTFFIHCWDVVKVEVIAAIQNFHSQGYFEKSFNATFITLIPKKMGATELKDFRPISLITSVYKIISKVLTERLKKVMSKLVDTHQLAFIKGRQIMDAILIANECVDVRKITEIPGILCKLDIEKAYDHLNWDFMWYTLENPDYFHL
ncbi:hypothetical protein MTR67_044842 [Solanum verrucosum]|uniref:Reverse transcriptase domain-containing protein n=1 Tax=Solanum verrucosum TaxID=315347 RepID=A0AAF0URY6_SOLVR|nr:hypothetical protein MTR67_044842 [Solanum verrucosum]